MTKKTIYTFLKVLIIAGSLIFIYFKLEEIQSIREEIKTLHFTPAKVFFLIAAILLMPVNWIFEAAKWKYLVKRLEKLSLITSLKAVFSGIAISLFAPNRSGEFLGRVLFLDEEKRAKGIASTILGSFSQVTVTFLTGIIGFIFIDKNVFGGLMKFEISQPLFLVSGFLIALTGLILYFKVTWIAWLFRKWFPGKKIAATIGILNEYTSIELLNALLLSFLRYAVFVLQLFFLFRFFNVELNLADIFVCISATYFVMSFIPTFTLAEIGVRNSVILYFTAFYSTHTFGIVSASTLLWMTNLLLPALAGNYFLARVRITTS